MELRRIHPDQALLTPQEALQGLRLGDRAPADRPFVVSNMVSTADGKATVSGRSGPIGTEVDRELFLTLRTQCDAILVGTGTLRAERYGPLVPDAGRRAAREREGLAAKPIGCVVSRTLSIPLDIALFQDRGSTIAVYTSSDAELAPCPADVRLTRLDPAEMTMTAVLRRLRADHDVRSVLCEGGPTVLGALLHEGMVDELFLSLSPNLAGGSDPMTIVAGPPLSGLVGLELVWVLEAASALFARYAVLR